MHLVVADQRPNGGRANHDLGGHHATATFGPLQERLRQHALEHERELRAHLRLLVRREHVDDTVDRLGGRVGVQRRKRQVAGLGDRQRRLNRLEIAHFADQHDVGVLAQRVLERGLEAVGIGPHLALVDDARLMAVDELDRIFHRDDVPFQLFIDLVDHRGERGAFDRAGWTRDEHEPARTVGELGHHVGQAELVERLHVERNLPDDDRHAAALLEHVAAEARQVLDAEREVELILGEDRVCERQGVLGRHDLFALRVHDVAVHADLGPLARHEVEVGSVLLDHLLEQRPEVDWHASSPYPAAVSLTTSSSVVTPFLTFSIPSMRSVNMPSFTARSRSSSVEAPLRISRRSGLVSAITSYSPWRPRYPVPAHVSQPAPLKNGPSFLSIRKACISSGVYSCCAFQSLQMRRTSRCAAIRLTALATLNGSMPMSTMRVMVDGASLVCSVESTRWPVSAALIAIEPVSRSRISPTMMMFGSWRRNAFSAAANVIPTSLRTST